MSLETKWKTALTSILEELDESEYKKMLFSLNKIPKSVKSGKVREEMPQMIIQFYGAEESVFVMNKLMKQIPRMDFKIQDRLQPFVLKLKSKRQKVNKNQPQICQPGKKKKLPQNQKGSSRSATKATAGRVVKKSAPNTNLTKKKAGSVKPKQKKRNV